MSKLYFKVASDWQEVVRLRNEIAKLETQIKSMDANKAPQAVAVLNSQLQQTKQQMQGMITEAAKAGAAMENDFKSKIYQSSKSINDFTEKIINQKNVIGILQMNLRKNKELYKTITLSGNDDKTLLNRIREQEKMLGKERDALFKLTQEQANARLSVKKLRDEYSLYKNDGKQVVETNQSIGSSIGKAFAIIGGVAAIKQLGSEIIKVRGEFQSMQTAIETLVGKDIAGNLIPQIKELAKISPLTLSDMVGAEKMMLGFNIKAEDTIRYLQALGDISMGNSQKFNSLTLAFSQMSATGKLMGQDLNQMINAGFNPLQQIAQSTGKSIATLKDEMSKGAISAEMVQQAFMDATSAGGKFFGMSENASRTINGQISMMQDALDEVFNEIGTKGEGAIMSGIQATTSLIQNYETVGKILTGLIATFGVYKAATVAYYAITKAYGIYDIATKELQFAATMKNIVATKALAVQQALLNKTMLNNPYVLVTTLVVGAATAMWVLADHTTTAEKAQKRFNDSLDAQKQQLDNLKSSAIDLINTIKSETNTQYEKMEAYLKLQKIFPEVFKNMDIEKIKLMGLVTYEKLLAEAKTRREIVGAKTNLVLKTNAYDEAKERYSKTSSNNSNVLAYYAQMKAAEEDMKLAQKHVDDILKIQAEARESLKPVGVKLFEAQNSRDEIVQEYAAARLTIEEEQRKIQESGFGVIPIDVQIRFDKAQVELANINKTIASLRQGNTSQTYKEAYNIAQKEWKSAQKALEESKKKSKADYDKAKKDLDEKEKAYKDLGGITGSSLTKQESAAEKLRKEQEKLTEEMKKSIQERKELLIQSEMDIQQQQIDLKEEGAEKELAQIQLNYDRQYQEIAKRERELLEKLQNEERKQWEKDNPNYEKIGLKFTPKTTSLTPEQREPFDKEYSLAFQKQEKDTQSMLEKLLEKYRDFDAQRTAIEKDGNTEIAYLQEQRTNANANEIDRAIAVAKQKMKEGVQAITDTEASKTAEDNPFLKNLFGDTSQMAFKDLQNLIEQAKQVQSYLSGNGDSSGITFISPEQLKTIAESPDELDKLKKALDKLLKGEKGNEWDDIFEGFTKGLAKVKSAKGFKEFSEGMQDIGNSASKASSMIGGVAGNLSSMFEEMGNTGAADAMSGVQDAMNAISNIGQGFAKGGIVGGIAAAVGEAANFIGKAFAANARHKAALKEIMNETIAQQREYNLLLMQQNLEYEKAATIFGTDVYGKAANAVRVMKEAVADLKEELAGTTEQKKNQSKDALFKNFFGVSNPQAELKKAYAGLADIEIKTGHKKTGLFGWGKGKDIYSSILDVYPQLVDANGKFDKSLAETIINTKTMSDDSKNALQNMIDLANQAEETYNQLNDYMTDIFGDLGSSMTDALVDAFANGTDAAQAFTDSVSNMLETLAKQMIYSVTLAPMMEKAQKEMMDVMQDVGLSDEQKFSKWTGILDGLVDDAVNQQGLANRLLEEYQQTAKDKGYEIFSPDKSTSQNSTQKGFETMSQDTGTELNGRFTALQVAGEEIKNQNILQSQSLNLLTMKSEDILRANLEIRDIAGETRDLIANSYLELVQISENTGAIIKPIKDMAKDIAEVKKNTSKL